jgi:hypothetical protein
MESSLRAIRARDDNRRQYTRRVLRPEDGSLDHVLPRSRGGRQRSLSRQLWRKSVHRMDYRKRNEAVVAEKALMLEPREPNYQNRDLRSIR